MLQLQLRSSPPSADGVQLLQIGQLRLSHASRRLPPGQVAHTQGPGDGDADNLAVNLCLDELIQEEKISPSSTAVKLFSGSPDGELPPFVELPAGYGHEELCHELKTWGHECCCALFTNHNLAVCYPHHLLSPACPSSIVSLRVDTECQPFYHLDFDHLPDTELGMMRFLYQLGFWRACIEFVLADPIYPVKLVG